MIYITIPETDFKSSNEFVKSISPQDGSDTFIVNRSDEKTGTNYCIVSLPDDGSPFVEAMKKQFKFTDYLEGSYNTRGITKEQALKPTMTVKVPGVLGIGTKDETVDAVDFISSLKAIDTQRIQIEPPIDPVEEKVV